MNAFQPNPWYIEMSWHMFSAIWRSPHAVSNIAKVKPFNTLSHHILLHLNKTNPPSAREAMTKNQDVFIFKATNNMFSPLVKKKQEKPKSHLLDHNLTSQHRLSHVAVDAVLVSKAHNNLHRLTLMYCRHLSLRPSLYIIDKIMKILFDWYIWHCLKFSVSCVNKKKLGLSYIGSWAPT